MEVSTMLGKLMKYDLKSMFKVFVPLWLALLAVSVVNRFTIQFDSNAIIGGLPTVIFMILYVGLIIAVMVVAVALIIMRFYHGLLKDEGYLMFTLPRWKMNWTAWISSMAWAFAIWASPIPSPMRWEAVSRRIMTAA